jgi:hypothetical protein
MRVARLLAGVFALAFAAIPLAQQVPAPAATVVRPIAAPLVPLPPESASANVTKFAFIAYGDTRGPDDGQILQPQHAAVVEAMINAIPGEAAAGFPVKFVVQSGDAVNNGREAAQWNVSYIPIIERITREAGLPYFFGVGNHDMGGRPAGDPDRELRYRNVLAANSKLWPADGPRKLAGYPVFAFGYGHVFFISFDSNIPDDQVQLKWVSDLLEHLDRARFRVVIALFHHPPITSGAHGGPTVVERESEGIRKMYLPLFRRHHVRLLVMGHDHLYDHYVEHYEDATGTHRMDEVVSGGGGGPIYTYRGEPDLARYSATALPQRVTIEHVARPGPAQADNPHHFVIFEIDGDRIWEKWVATVSAPFAPFGQPRTELADR